MDFHDENKIYNINEIEFEFFYNRIYSLEAKKAMTRTDWTLFAKLVDDNIDNFKKIKGSQLIRIFKKIQVNQYKNGGRLLFTSELHNLFKQAVEN